MMRLVAFLALVVVALAQEDDGSYHADRYENPYAYSEQQAAAPQAPQYQPQAAPQYQPQIPQYQPQIPQYQPQAPQYQPQAPQYQPQAPQYQPQAPQYQPQAPQYQPQAHQYQPQAPQYQPQAPQYQQYQAQPQYQTAGQSANALPQTSTNYKTQDHERFENVDGQGNVRGQYSYVDPNGKTITIKYTAGKDGFQVEGDHLPRAPVPGAPAAAAYQPRYQPAAAPAAYQPRYQPAAPAPAPVYQQAQGPPSAASQYLNSPLQHRFAAAPAAPGVPGQAYHQAEGNGYNYNF